MCDLETQSDMNQSKPTEKEIATALLGDFDPKKSRSMAVMATKSPNELSKLSVLSVAMVLSILSGVRITRHWKRRKFLIYKWMDDHYEKLEPFFPEIELKQTMD
jgi:hypothetical protein